MTLPPMQRGPAAWTAHDMAANGDWIMKLTDAHIGELERAARACKQLLAKIDRASFELPTLGPELDAMRRELLHGRGFVLVRGLAVNRYSREELAAMFIGLGAHLGKPRSQNAKGHILGHVYDLGRSSGDPNARIYQTTERQTFHTDSCDVVGLLCLREAKEGGDSLLTSALSVYNLLHERHPGLLERLMTPMPHDRRGEVPEGQKPYFDIPVFSFFEGELTVFYQRQYFDSAQRFEDARRLTKDDVRALDAFDAATNDPSLCLRMRLQPGDIQLVHNHTMLHDRTSFVDWLEPEKKRHLLRLWLACPGARPLPEAFRARYGSLEIGDRGGITVPGTSLSTPLDPI